MHSCQFRLEPRLQLAPYTPYTVSARQLLEFSRDPGLARRAVAERSSFLSIDSDVVAFEPAGWQPDKIVHGVPSVRGRLDQSRDKPGAVMSPP